MFANCKNAARRLAEFAAKTLAALFAPLIAVAVPRGKTATLAGMLFSVSDGGASQSPPAVGGGDPHKHGGDSRKREPYGWFLGIALCAVIVFAFYARNIWWAGAAFVAWLFALLIVQVLTSTPEKRPGAKVVLYSHLLMVVLLAVFAFVFGADDLWRAGVTFDDLWWIGAAISIWFVGSFVIYFFMLPKDMDFPEMEIPGEKGRYSFSTIVAGVCVIGSALLFFLTPHADLAEGLFLLGAVFYIGVITLYKNNRSSVFWIAIMGACMGAGAGLLIISGMRYEEWWETMFFAAFMISGIMFSKERRRKILNGGLKNAIQVFAASALIAGVFVGLFVPA